MRDKGPADHIRTKHEVEAFVDTGDLTAAEALLTRASERRVQQQQGVSVKQAQQRGRRMEQ